MWWFKSKREKMLEALIESQREIISRMNRISDASAFVSVPIPQPGDMAEYQRKIAMMIDDSFLLFYLTQLRRSFVDAFEFNSDGSKADYFRGKLACLGDIFSDARKARMELSRGMIKPEGAEDAA